MNSSTVIAHAAFQSNDLSSAAAVARHMAIEWYSMCPCSCNYFELQRGSSDIHQAILYSRVYRNTHVHAIIHLCNADRFNPLLQFNLVLRLIAILRTLTMILITQFCLQIHNIQGEDQRSAGIEQMIGTLRMMKYLTTFKNVAVASNRDTQKGHVRQLFNQ